MATPKRAWLLASLSILTGIALMTYMIGARDDRSDERVDREPRDSLTNDWQDNNRNNDWPGEEAADDRIARVGDVAESGGIEIDVTADTLDDWCAIDLAAAVEIQPGSLLIDDGELGRVTLQAGGEVLVDGTPIAIDPGALATIEALDAELRKVAPEMVDIARDGLDLARTTVDDVFAALTDEDPPLPMLDALDELESRLQQRYDMQEGTARVEANGLAAVETILQDIEPQLETALGSSLGALMSTAGDALADEDRSFEENMEAFGERMARFGTAMETGIGVEAEVLEVRGAALCSRLQRVEELQEDIGRDVPALAGLRIVQ